MPSAAPLFFSEFSQQLQILLNYDHYLSLVINDYSFKILKGTLSMFCIPHYRLFVSFNTINSLIQRNKFYSVALYLFIFLPQGRTNLPPEKVPWDALATLMSQCIYGGKIDNEFDQRLLTSFLNKLFTPKSFDPEFPLVCNVDGRSPLTGRMIGHSLGYSPLKDDISWVYR